MSSRFHTVVIVSTLAVLLAAATAHAGIYRVYFNVFTQFDPNNASYPQLLVAEIDVSDTVSRAPDAVNWTKPFTITAPTGEILTVPSSSWDEWSNGFYPSWTPSAFVNNKGVIPPGKYVLTLSDKSTKPVKFTSSKTLAAASFLNSPIVTNPTEGSVLSDLNSKVTWNSVPGALYYRLTLRYDGTSGGTPASPIYNWPNTHKEVYMTSYTFPAGVLRSNRSYVLQVEARDTDKGMSKRARSMWIHFTTGAQ